MYQTKNNNTTSSISLERADQQYQPSFMKYTDTDDQEEDEEQLLHSVVNGKFQDGQDFSSSSNNPYVQVNQNTLLANQREKNQSHRHIHMKKVQEQYQYPLNQPQKQSQSPQMKQSDQSSPSSMNYSTQSDQSTTNTTQISDDQNAQLNEELSSILEDCPAIKRRHSPSNPNQTDLSSNFSNQATHPNSSNQVANDQKTQFQSQFEEYKSFHSPPLDIFDLEYMPEFNQFHTTLPIMSRKFDFNFRNQNSKVECFLETYIFLKNYTSIEKGATSFRAFLVNALTTGSFRFPKVLNTVYKFAASDKYQTNEFNSELANNTNEFKIKLTPSSLRLIKQEVKHHSSSSSLKQSQPSSSKMIQRLFQKLPLDKSKDTQTRRSDNSNNTPRSESDQIDDDINNCHQVLLENQNQLLQCILYEENEDYYTANQKMNENIQTNENIQKSDREKEEEELEDEINQINDSISYCQEIAAIKNQPPLSEEEIMLLKSKIDINFVNISTDYKQTIKNLQKEEKLATAQQIENSNHISSSSSSEQQLS